MRAYLSIFLVGLMLCLASCSSQAEVPEVSLSPSTSTSTSASPSASQPVIATVTPSEEVTPTPLPQLTWVPQTISQSWSTEDEETLLMTARYVLPAAEYPEADPAWAIITSYYQTLAADYLAAAEITLSYAEDDYVMAQEYDYSFTTYTEEASYEVSYQTDSIVSFVRALYTNTGGAYPSILQYSETFNLYSGEQLTFDDCFSDPETARALVLATIHTVTDEMDEIYADDVDNFFQADQFYLTDEGFVFYYQLGTLGPNALGIPEFTVAFTQLSDVMVR